MLGRRRRSGRAVRPLAERTMIAATAAAITAATTTRTTMAAVMIVRTLVVARLALFARTLRRSRRHVLVGRRRDDGDALVGQPLDALELAALARIAERQRDARSAGARGAADAMDVALGVGRQLVVDDVGHADDVDAARGEIGGDQHAGAPAAEIVERLLAGILRLVAVDRLGRHAAVL